ncbi:Ubiquitin thioesterase OTU1 [Orchesella cincta]|uniref:Ubiquitin thioesterase OTU n=1 Tax=Orchesella cincta TaxID=48709 RepID=A0A1D2M8R9_ORCCI|nr:Ubiquitin thioesterase OTU1 [Orchesella cincta]
MHTISRTHNPKNGNVPHIQLLGDIALAIVDKYSFVQDKIWLKMPIRWTRSVQRVKARQNMKEVFPWIAIQFIHGFVGVYALLLVTGYGGTPKNELKTWTKIIFTFLIIVDVAIMTISYTLWSKRDLIAACFNAVGQLPKRLAMATGSKKLTLRVKSLMSPNVVLRDVDPQETVRSLLGKLSAVTGVPEGNMALLKGSTPNPTRLVGDDDSGLLLRHTVPSDNSCLFSSVAFCLSGGQRLQGDSSSLREMIANTEPESWGGGIELAILSEFYGMQISVVNTQSVHISNFGEDQNFAERIFLIYDGVHYDPLYFEPFNGGSTRTKFEVRNTRMNDLAMQLAHEAHASHQFTDLKLLAPVPDL